MHALIIASGFILPKKYIVRLLRTANLIICADGGANHALKLHITPDVILGDFDSITSSTKKSFRGVPQLYIEDRYSTDLEKAITYCIQHDIQSADIIGATGNRIDHTTGSLGCFKKFGRKIRLRFMDSNGELTLIHHQNHIQTKIGERLSLIPLDRCTGVTTHNLKYALHNATLELGVQEGISNEATSTTVTISVKKGTLLLFRYHDDRKPKH